MRDSWWIASASPLDMVQECRAIQDLLDPNDNFYLAVLDFKDTEGWMPSIAWDYFKKHI